MDGVSTPLKFMYLNCGLINDFKRIILAVLFALFRSRSKRARIFQAFRATTYVALKTARIVHLKFVLLTFPTNYL